MSGGRKYALKATETHCKNGHRWDLPNNTIILNNGFNTRVCRKCKRESQAKAREHYKRLGISTGY